MLLEVVIFKRSGTKLFMFKIVCIMYLKIQLCRNLHTLLSWFNKQMEFDKKSCFSEIMQFCIENVIKKIGVIICYSYQLWAQCIKMRDHEEFAYFVGLDH